MANDEGVRAINQDEHNEDAHSKRVVLKYQDPSSGDWINFVPDKVGGIDYDYVDVQQTNAVTDTYVFMTGGSGGTTVQTVTIVYTDSDKTDVDTVSYA